MKILIQTFFRSKIAQLQQEYRDLRQYILHDTSLEANVTRAVLAALLVLLVGTLVLSLPQPLPPLDTETGAHII